MRRKNEPGCQQLIDLDSIFPDSIVTPVIQSKELSPRSNMGAFGIRVAHVGAIFGLEHTLAYSPDMTIYNRSLLVENARGDNEATPLRDSVACSPRSRTYPTRRVSRLIWM